MGLFLFTINAPALILRGSMLADMVKAISFSPALFRELTEVMILSGSPLSSPQIISAIYFNFFISLPVKNMGELRPVEHDGH